jgi:hypothetical protein
MLQTLPAPMLGAVMTLLLCFNTVFWVIPLYLATLIKLIAPKGRARDTVSRWVAWSAQRWSGVNIWLSDRLLPVRWDVRGVERLVPITRVGTISSCCSKRSTGARRSSNSSSSSS